LYLSVSNRINPVLKIRRLSWPCEESRKKKKRLCSRFVVCHARQSLSTFFWKYCLYMWWCLCVVVVVSSLFHINMEATITGWVSGLLWYSSSSCCLFNNMRREDDSFKGWLYQVDMCCVCGVVCSTMKSRVENIGGVQSWSPLVIEKWCVMQIFSSYQPHIWSPYYSSLIQHWTIPKKEEPKTIAMFGKRHKNIQSATSATSSTTPPSNKYYK
jgi:hypothetical protein